MPHTQALGSINMRSYILVACTLLVSCYDNSNDIEVRTKQCYPMNNDAYLYAAALKELSIPHTFDEQEKCIHGGKVLSDTQSEVELKAFGTPPPSGLSTTYRHGNAPFIKLLNANGIKTEIITYKEMDYIVWRYEDHQKAEELLGFEPWLRDMMRESRNNGGG